MKFKPVKLAPALIATGVILLVCLARVLQLDYFERQEQITYDWRVRTALRFPQPVATNLGFVFMDEDSIAALNNGSLGYRYGLLWPRHIYGRVLRELSAQGAKLVTFDILFGELRVDHASVGEPPGRWPDLTNFLAALHPGQKLPISEDGSVFAESDDYFAWQLKRTGIGAVAAQEGVLPHPLFLTNAVGKGDISAEVDEGEGVLRRAKAFRTYRRWHWAFQKTEAEFGFDLTKARLEPGQIVLTRGQGETLKVPVDADNEFDVTQLFVPPPGTPTRDKAFTEERVWHMGVVLAACALKLDLANADVNLEQGRIALRGANGVQRVLPVDRDGFFLINWELTANDRRLTKEAIERLLAQDQARVAGDLDGLTNRWRGKLVIVGSSAVGNNLGDRGTTPLEKHTLLVSKHWNVANSIITGRFVRRASLPTELVLIALLGVVTAILTWQLRVFPAAGAVILLAVLYGAAAVLLYVQYRYWLPLVLPIVGAMLLEHVCLVTYRVVFEQTERRRVKSVFSKIVSPDVVNELLQAETLSLGGARREVTVLFADVRGFTELSDTSHERAAAYVRDQHLTGPLAAACFDESARETLNTVNLYLACVADYVKLHHGTLDKYIGDCVMAFWGAPTPNARHALTCVRAAIDAQRAIHRLNEQRLEENRRLEEENRARAASGLPPQPLHATLKLGTGINSGLVTVGLMGSDAHILNYTVFGREVNLASRLEGVSGHGRIVISETTYQHLQRDDPALAATCIELQPVKLKGFKDAVKNYAVPWQAPTPSPAATTENAAATPKPN